MSIDFVRHSRNFVTHSLATSFYLSAACPSCWLPPPLGFVFIVRKPEFEIPTFRYAVFLIGLFALFCETQELEQLAELAREVRHPFDPSESNRKKAPRL